MKKLLLVGMFLVSSIGMAEKIDCTKVKTDALREAKQVNADSFVDYQVMRLEDAGCDVEADELRENNESKEDFIDPIDLDEILAKINNLKLKKIDIYKANFLTCPKNHFYTKRGCIEITREAQEEAAKVNNCTAIERQYKLEMEHLEDQYDVTNRQLQNANRLHQERLAELGCKETAQGVSSQEADTSWMSPMDCHGTDMYGKCQPGK